MSLPKSNNYDLFNAATKLRGFLAADDPFMMFAKEIAPKFKDEDLKDSYSTKGRAAISPAFLCLVTLLQWHDNLSDTETVKACERRLDWKIALGLPLEGKDFFEASTLCYFRKRLLNNGKENFIFDKILGLCQEKGFVEKRKKQRIDATHIIKRLNRLSTTDLLFRSVQLVVKKVKKSDAHFYEEHIPEDIKERYSKTFSSFGLSKVSRVGKQAELIEDGYLLQSILEREEELSANVFEQLEIMHTIFRENVIIHKKEINNKIFIEAEEIQSPKQTIVDPQDQSIQVGIKGKTKWVGSKCQIMETANQGEINFITGMIEQDAIEDDSKFHEKARGHNESHNLHPEKVYVDQNYMSGYAIREYRDNDQELMGYIRMDTSRRDEEYKIKNFTIDIANRTAICPQGKESCSFNKQKDGGWNARFDKQDCSICPVYQKCVKQTKSGIRTLRISPYYKEIYERREDRQDRAFRREMRVRAQIEGTISELVRFHNLRKIKYKNKNGRQLQCLLAGATLNVKRIIKAINQGLVLQPATS